MATLIAASGLFASGCIIVSDDENIITIDNQSDYFIDEIYIAENGDISWGDNLAPGDGLAPNELLDVEVDCGVYDLLIVDETGLECEAQGLDLCLNDDDIFVFRNNSCRVIEAAPNDKAKAAEGTKDATDAVSTPEAQPAPLL